MSKKVNLEVKNINYEKIRTNLKYLFHVNEEYFTMVNNDLNEMLVNYNYSYNEFLFLYTEYFQYITDRTNNIDNILLITDDLCDEPYFTKYNPDFVYFHLQTINIMNVICDNDGKGEYLL